MHSYFGLHKPRDELQKHVFVDKYDLSNRLEDFQIYIQLFTKFILSCILQLNQFVLFIMIHSWKHFSAYPCEKTNLHLEGNLR